MKVETRYTLNSDGTVEKWYLEKDCGDMIYLRKTGTPKFNCGMRAFPVKKVYASYVEAKRAMWNNPELAGEENKP